VFPLLRSSPGKKIAAESQLSNCPTSKGGKREGHGVSSAGGRSPGETGGQFL